MTEVEQLQRQLQEEQSLTDLFRGVAQELARERDEARDVARRLLMADEVSDIDRWRKSYHWLDESEDALIPIGDVIGGRVEVFVDLPQDRVFVSADRGLYGYWLTDAESEALAEKLGEAAWELRRRRGKR